MSADVNPPRREYRSPARAEQARATRARILEAAATLFVRDGYAGTTMRDVADAAGTSERTVYLAFTTKAQLLSEAIRAAVRMGDDETPMLQQAAWRDLEGRSAAEVCERLARATTGLWERVAALIRVAEAAALSDPALAAFRDRGREATAHDLHEVARALERAGLLRPGLGADYVADALYALLGSSDVYLRLVETRGWSPDDVAGLLERTLTALIDAP